MLAKEYNVETLLKSIQSIPLEKAYKSGVTSVKLFKPVLRSESNKLNFILETDENSSFSLFDRTRIKRQLKDYFKVDINIIIEGEIREEKKPQIIGESINLNSPDMHKFLNDYIIPFAKTWEKYVEESDTVDSEETSKESIAKNKN